MPDKAAGSFVLSLYICDMIRCSGKRSKCVIHTSEWRCRGCGLFSCSKNILSFQ